MLQFMQIDKPWHYSRLVHRWDMAYFIVIAKAPIMFFHAIVCAANLFTVPYHEDCE